MKERNGYVFSDNNKWYARATFTDAQGKRRNIKRTAKTESEAKKTLRKILNELENDGEQAFDIAALTFNDLLVHYEQYFCVPAEYTNGRKVSGLRDVSRAKSVLPHFRAFFGNRKLQSITYGDIASYKRMRAKQPTHLKQPRSVGTMNRELGILRRIFNIGLAESWIKKNPFQSGEPLISPADENKRERILTIDEERRLLDACNEPCRIHIKPIVIALLDTGARKGEMLKLVWRDVDFDNSIITIRGETTKTLRSRQVVITHRLLNEFTALWEQSDKNLTAKVFGFKIFRKAFQTACKIAGIKAGGLDGLVTHSLRHTTAVRLIKGNMPIQLAGRILGHTNPATTYRYLSANEDTLREAASILEAIQTNNDSPPNAAH